MKVCTKCKFDYPEPLEDFFSKKAGTKDGFQGVCKTCHSEYLKIHYSENKEYYKSKAASFNKARRPQALQFVVDYLKNHPCVDCGESDPVVLEFDHVRDKKHKEISRMIRDGASNEALELEIAKCDVRCANCHRRKTAEQFGWYSDIQL